MPVEIERARGSVGVPGSVDVRARREGARCVPSGAPSFAPAWRAHLSGTGCILLSAEPAAGCTAPDADALALRLYGYAYGFI